MAFAWIKIEDSTPDKPEVWKMAERLAIDADAVLGKLVRIWIWADQQTLDGNAASVTRALLDRCAGVTGFADAMIAVGWLKATEDGVSFLHFERHNGETAKKRALTRRRVERHRSGNADSVTETPIGNAGGVTKRREEKKNNKTETETRARTRGQASAESQPPASDPVLADLDAPADPVIIPEAMRAPEVLKAARQWFRHLQTRAPERVPIPASPQLQEFWQRHARWGPERFKAAVSFSVARGYLNLVEERDDDGGGRKRTGQAAGAAERLTPNQQREINNRRAFEIVFGEAPGDWEGARTTLRREEDRLHPSAVVDVGASLELLLLGSRGSGDNDGGPEHGPLPAAGGSDQSDTAGAK